MNDILTEIDSGVMTIEPLAKLPALAVAKGSDHGVS